MIRFDNVKKKYPSGVEALKGINFLIENGEFVFIIGKSGSGKSTLMKCITREEKPTEGKVTIDNFNISNMSRALVPVLRRQLGMIYQDFRLIETKTVFENVAFAGEIIGTNKKSLAQTVNLMLSIVGLKDKQDCFPQELSGGEQQRVAIARAMLNNPQIIVADEPTGNLDPETSENIMALLQEINRNGTTVIVCTHDSNLVDRMKKRVIEIDNGYIVRDAMESAYVGESNIAHPTEDFGGFGVDAPESADDYVDYMNEPDEFASENEYAEEAVEDSLVSAVSAFDDSTEETESTFEIVEEEVPDMKADESEADEVIDEVLTVAFDETETEESDEEVPVANDNFSFGDYNTDDETDIIPEDPAPVAPAKPSTTFNTPAMELEVPSTGERVATDSFMKKDENSEESTKGWADDISVDDIDLFGDSEEE